MADTQRTCTFDGCDRPLKAASLCYTHYRQYRLGKPLAPIAAKYANKVKPRVGCSFDDCEDAHYSAGLCGGHYTQMRRGRPLASLKVRASVGMSLQDRLDMYTDKSDPDGCWLWTGHRQHSGHGRMYHPGLRRSTMSHRVAFEVANGPIPDDLEIDHICRVKECVNPSHLQLATRSENEQNHNGPTRRNTSGVRGVSWHAGAWEVRVDHQRKQHYGGRFSNIQDAEAAVLALRNRLHTNNLLDRGL